MKLESKHDFTLKLRQQTLWPRVMDYVKWQRAVREALSKKQAPPIMPDSLGVISINLDLTTACNYACAHCIDWDIINSGINHEYEKLQASLRNLIEHGLRSVILIGGGESTLHPKFTEVVRFLKQQQLQVAIVYNGSRSDRVYEIADTLVAKDWIRLSLDSGTNETFQRMHRPKKPVSLEEICSWIPKIRNRNPKLTIGFSFVIVWDGGERKQEGEKAVPNIKEIALAAKLAQESGFSYISFKPFLTRFTNGAEVMDPVAMTNGKMALEEIHNGIKEAKRFETDAFRVIESTNLRVLTQGNWRDFTHQPKNCHLTAFRQVLSPLGVFHCSAHRGIEKAKVGEAALWSNPDTTEARQAVAEKILGFNAKHECREITCLYHGANHWIEAMINGDVQDLNAVPDSDDYYL